MVSPGLTIPLTVLLATVFPGVAGAAELAVNAYNPFPVGSPRVMGMAGAFTAIGSGAESLMANPVAAVRPDGFRLGSVEFDYMLSLTRQDEGVNSDFGNVGDLHGSAYVTLLGYGLLAKWNGDNGKVRGIGIHGLVENYWFTDSAGEIASFSLNSPRLTYATSYGRNNDLYLSYSLGGGAPSLMYMDPDTSTQVNIEYEGVASIPMELGLLWTPRGRSFQAGARVKGPSISTTSQSIPSIDPFPSTVVFPGEWAAGVAWFAGERMPEGRGAWFDRAIVGLDVRGVFPLRGTTGFERLNSPDPLEILAEPLLQPSIGVEVELYTRVLWMWFGIYNEPARYSDVGDRAHFTSGFKTRLFQVRDFGLYLSAAGDVAQNFNVWMVSFTTGPGKF